MCEKGYLPIKLTARKMSSNAGMLFVQLPQSAMIYTTCECHKYLMQQKSVLRFVGVCDNPPPPKGHGHCNTKVKAIAIPNVMTISNYCLTWSLEDSHLYKAL